MKTRRGRSGQSAVEALGALLIISLFLMMVVDAAGSLRATQRKSIVAIENARILKSMLAPASFDGCVEYDLGDPPSTECLEGIAETLRTAQSANDLAAEDDRPEIIHRVDEPTPDPDLRPMKYNNPHDVFVLSPEPYRGGPDRCQAIEANGDRALEMHARRTATVKAVFQSGKLRDSAPITDSGTRQSRVLADDMSWFGVPVDPATPSGQYPTSPEILPVEIGKFDPATGQRPFPPPLSPEEPWEFRPDSPGPGGCFIILAPYNAAVAYVEPVTSNTVVCIMTEPGPMRRCGT